MYSVEALIPQLGPTDAIPRDEWTSVYDVPQQETEQEELTEVRWQAAMARRFYVNVRITKSVGGLRSVVA